MPRKNRSKMTSNKILISVFFSIVLITSILGIILGNDSSTTDSNSYNGTEFVTSGNYWQFEYEGKDVQVYNHPSVLEDVDVDPAVFSAIKSTKIVYISTPVLGENLNYIGTAAYELSDALNLIGIYTSQGISDNNTNYQVPLITCENSTQFVPVVLFNYTNESRIHMDGNCIRVDSETRYDVIRNSDRLVLGLLGVM